MEFIELGTGFSIELIGWRLEYRGEHEGLPLYESIGGEVTAIAIVDDPAIGVKARGNDKERIIAGIVMIPDLKMFRTLGPNGPENCYWYFSASTIKHLQENFKGEIKFGH